MVVCKFVKVIKMFVHKLCIQKSICIIHFIFSSVVYFKAIPKITYQSNIFDLPTTIRLLALS